MEFDYINVGELLNNKYNKLSTTAKNWPYGGLGLTLQSILKTELI